MRDSERAREAQRERDRKRESDRDEGCYNNRVRNKQKLAQVFEKERD